MHIPKKYFQDRFVLLLLTMLIFFATLTALTIAFRIGGERNTGLITEYRPTLGIGGFQKGSPLDIVSFAVFAVVAAIFHIAISLRVYTIRKHVSHVILGLGVLLVLLALIISNSLLLLS